jgi:ribosome modulation factor
MSSSSQLYRDGWEAAVQGLDPEDCPYDHEPTFRAWMTGYKDFLRERQKDLLWQKDLLREKD